MELDVGEVRLKLARGDIAKQEDLDAVVNAANAQLRTGGGVADAIHRAAGPGLAEECRPLAPIEPGQAVITGAHELPNERVIHCLGPVYGEDEPADELLATCYRQALASAEEEHLASVGFPAISTGAFGYPEEDAADVTMATLREELPRLSSLELVRIVLWGEGSYEVHRRAAEDVIGDAGQA